VLGRYETEEDVPPDLSVRLETPPVRKGSFAKKLSIIYKGSTEATSTLSPQRLFRRVLAEVESARLTARDDALYVLMTPVVANGKGVIMPAVTTEWRKRWIRRLDRKGIAVCDGRWSRIDVQTGELTPFTWSFEVSDEIFDRLAEISPEPQSHQPGLADVAAEANIAAVLLWGGKDLEQVGQMHRPTTLRTLVALTVNRIGLPRETLSTLTDVVTRADCISVPSTGAEMPSMYQAITTAIGG
jgi:hypothetical protein